MSIKSQVEHIYLNGEACEDKGQEHFHTFDHGFEEDHAELRVIAALEQSVMQVKGLERFPRPQGGPTYVSAFVMLVDEHGKITINMATNNNAYAMSGMLHAAAARLVEKAGKQ